MRHKVRAKIKALFLTFKKVLVNYYDDIIYILYCYRWDSVSVPYNKIKCIIYRHQCKSNKTKVKVYELVQKGICEVYITHEDIAI